MRFSLAGFIISKRRIAPQLRSIRVSFISFLQFAGIIKNSADIGDVGVTERDKLLTRSLRATSRTAVDEDRSALVRECHCDIGAKRTQRNIDRSWNMALGKLANFADIRKNRPCRATRPSSIDNVFSSPSISHPSVILFWNGENSADHRGIPVILHAAALLHLEAHLVGLVEELGLLDRALRKGIAEEIRIAALPGRRREYQHILHFQFPFNSKILYDLHRPETSADHHSRGESFSSQPSPTINQV